MNPRAFTNVISNYHARRLGRIFGLTPSLMDGIDLVGDSLGIELKCRSDRWHPTWAIHSYQIDGFPSKHSGKELYWGFLLYHLTCPVDRIPNGAERFLGLYVRQTQAWFLPWDCVRSFPVSNARTGPYVYVHHDDLPVKGFTQEEKLNYTLCVPQGSSLEERLRNPPLPLKPIVERTYLIKV